MYRILIKKAMVIDFRINEICKLNGIELKKSQQQCLEKFCNLLLKKNREFNLTAIVDPLEITLKHLVDSIKVEKLVKLQFNSKLLDVGAGAGFPSVPIAVVRPDLNVVQIDGLNKRVNFLKQVAVNCNLNVEVFHGRAEDFGKQSKFREKFDYVTARAVSQLNRLVEYALPFVKVGGLFIALKGKNYEIELENSKQAVKKLGGEICEIKKFELSCSMKRVLILIKKISQTPTKYPRINSKILKCEL